MRHLSLLCAMMLAMTAAAQAPADSVAAAYARTEAKAQLFYSNKEWHNAVAMYTLMLDMRPDETSVYSHAIMANALAGNSDMPVRLLEQSTHYDIPTDSLLGGVQSLALAQSRPDLYEDLLVRARTEMPWLARSFDARLLRFYDFRDNAPQMVAYATRLLQSAPDNAEFLAILARGYLLQGDASRAMTGWKRILDSDPDNLQALLSLGFCLRNLGDRDASIPLLTRAYSISPTPYLARILRL